MDCYSWNNADVSWMTANITWREACVIAKIITKTRGRGKTMRDFKLKELELTKDEEKTLINLIVRIKENGYLYNVDELKEKKTEIKVTSKDIKLFIRELTNIKVKAII